MKRSRLNARSKKMKKFYKNVRIPAVKQIVADGLSCCPVQSPVCTKYIEGVHEILPRGRAGGIIKAHRKDNLVGTCHRCNAYISEHPTWATSLGWLKHYDYNEQL
jgi:hypothetical protein